MKKLIMFGVLICSLIGSQGICGDLIKVDSTGRFLEWNGKKLILVGDSITNGWTDSGRGLHGWIDQETNERKFGLDYKGYIDALYSRNMNVVLLWAFNATNDSHQSNKIRTGYGAREYCPWVGTPEGRNFDLTKFNQNYFDRLKEFVSYAESRNIVVIITVFDGWVKQRSDAHPFNKAIGNGPLTALPYNDNPNDKRLIEFVKLFEPGKESAPLSANETIKSRYDFYDTVNNTAEKQNKFLQEVFALKLIDTLRDNTNVMYEMFNEGEWYDQDDRNNHEQHFLKFFKNHCKNVLLSNSNDNYIVGDDPYNDEKVDVVAQHGSWVTAWGKFPNFHEFPKTKPNMFSEPGLGWEGKEDKDGSKAGVDDIRRSVWETTLSGAGWVNQNDPSFGWDGESILRTFKDYEDRDLKARGLTDEEIIDIKNIIPRRDRVYDYVGYCAKFLNNVIRIENFEPHFKIAIPSDQKEDDHEDDKIYYRALVNNNNEYVVYYPGDPLRAFRVKYLSGTFSAYWLNPRDGTYHPGGTVNDNGNNLFTPPFGEDAVLYLTRNRPLAIIDDEIINPHQTEPVTAGDEIRLLGRGMAIGNYKIYSHRWVRGTNCGDRDEMICHQSDGNTESGCWQWFSPGLNTVSYVNWSRLQDQDGNYVQNPDGTFVAKMSYCVSKTFFLPDEKSCNRDNLHLCTDFLACGLARGYWCDDHWACEEKPNTPPYPPTVLRVR